MLKKTLSRVSSRCVRPVVDELESRLSPSTTPVAGSLTPAQVRHAYGFDQIHFGTVAGDGSGQTIAIVVAGSLSSIRSDLQTFDRQFGLADPPSLTITAPYGTTTATPTWALETALDVEWAHAAAPGAKLLLVEANTGGLADLIAAADFSRQQAGVSVVSMSWGSAEFAAETYFDATFTTPAGKSGVTFVASTGDSASSALWPAVSTNVIAVGGTQLTTDAAGNVLSETAWSSGGGGLSSFEKAPSGQSALTGSAQRGAPDVSFDAANLAVYCSTTVNGWTGWMTAGGTSAGVPQWAGLIAVANQGRALAGKAPLNNTPAAIYSLSASDFRDITAGSNGHSAGPGYDLVTGRGSPLANRVVNELVGPSTTPPVVSAPAHTPAPSQPTISQSPTKAQTTGTTTSSPQAPAPKVNLTLVTNLVINFLLKTTGKSLQQTPALAQTSTAVILPSAGANFLGTGIVAGPLAK
jgi:subtilase family serine protease